MTARTLDAIEVELTCDGCDHTFTALVQRGDEWACLAEARDTARDVLRWTCDGEGDWCSTCHAHRVIEKAVRA